MEGDMSQKPYYRDIWALGPSINGYPGAFPRGFIRMLKRKWWGQNRLWLFSGSYKDSEGTTVDINPDVKADYACNCEELPFDDNSYDQLYHIKIINSSTHEEFERIITDITEFEGLWVISWKTT